MSTGCLPNGTAIPKTASINTWPSTAYGTFPSPTLITVLPKASDYVFPFSKSVFTASVPALSQNATRIDLVTRFIAAYLQANLYLANPANKDCAIAAIASQLNISIPLAAAAYANTTETQTGEIPPEQESKFQISLKGLENVVKVRTEFDGFQNVSKGLQFHESTHAWPWQDGGLFCEGRSLGIDKGVELLMWVLEDE